MDNALMEFVRRLFLNTLSVELNYFRKPYLDFAVIDRKLGTSFTNAEKRYRQILEAIETMERSTIYIVCDKFFLRTIIFYPFPDKDDLISIGPYLTENVDNIFLNKVGSFNNLNMSQMKPLKSFYYNLPRFDSNIRLISAINDLLAYINPSSPTFDVRERSYPPKPIMIEHQPLEDYAAYADIVSERYQAEERLMGAVSNGDYPAAINQFQHFINYQTESHYGNNLSTQKELLLTINIILRKALSMNRIHPVYMYDISAKYAKLIMNSINMDELKKLPETMIQEYCRLVKNHSMKEYSATTAKILNFVDFNLSNPLSLNSISEKLRLSEPYISGQFKKEMGMGITAYISKKRLQEAAKLLKSTDLTIQDIAFYVGIIDSNYFTKLFKKEFHCTPTQYRKK